MPRAREWADEFEQGIKAYGISAEQIQRINDVDWETMGSTLTSVYDKIVENADLGRRTLLLCFFAGYGATKDGSTCALFNSNRHGLHYSELEN